MLSLKINRLLLIGLVVVQLCYSLPVEPQAAKKSQAEIRASLITKHNVKDYLAATRNKKQLSDIKLPAPFVVSTSLNINGNDGNDGRRGRSYSDGKGNTIVEGVRVPDDNSDKMTYRNGRFINNVFVPDTSVVTPDTSVVTPDTSVVPIETVISSDDKKSPRVAKMMSENKKEGRSFNPGFDEYYLGGGSPAAHDSMAVESKTFEQIVAAPRLGFAEPSETRDHVFKAGNTQKGRPVYYVVEEPDSLHADRSPYNFEPADNQDSFTDAVADFTHSGVSPANQGDFVIKEHTYTMCPGCPTFSIPVPIPKASLVEQQELQEEESVGNIDYQSAKDKNFLEKIGDRIVSTVKGIQDKTLGIFDPILSKGSNFLGLADDSNTITEKKGDAGGSKTSYLPMMLAGAAAAALGGLALFGTGPSVSTINARSLDDNAPVQVDNESTTAILDSISEATTKYEKQD